MRIAAGVLIILVALICDFPAGVGYAFIGGVANIGGKVVEAGQQVQKQQMEELDKKLSDPKLAAAAKKQLLDTKKQLSEVTKKETEELAKGAKDMQSLGAIVMPFGFFLLVLGCLGIAAAVVLFMGKASIFALIVGVLQLASEGLPIAMKGFWWGNIPGIVAGIFVIIGALSYPKRPPVA